jgi:hypothetical protein
VASLAGTVAGVAVIAAAATYLPDLGTATGRPGVAGTSPSPTPTLEHTKIVKVQKNYARPVDDPKVGDATLLMGCQVKLKNQVDLSKWRVVTRTTLPTIGTMLVATEPGGTRVVTCDLYAATVPAGLATSSTTHLWPKFHQAAKLSPNLMSAGTNCASGPKLPQACQGFLITEADRVPSQVVRIHVDFKNGRTLDVPVKDGWYSMMAASGRNGLVAPVYRAYDAAGKVVPFDGEQTLDSVRYP